MNLSLDGQASSPRANWQCHQVNKILTSINISKENFGDMKSRKKDLKAIGIQKGSQEDDSHEDGLLDKGVQHGRHAWSTRSVIVAEAIEML